MDKLNRQSTVTMSMLALLLVFVIMLPLYPAKAAFTLADGEYTIDYKVLTADSDSVSIANDYWDKPAKLLVKDGVITVQLQLNHSEWIVEYTSVYNGSFSAVDVISRDRVADTRVVQFKVNDLSTPVESKIHVIVPDIDYDNHYTIRLAFDTESIKSVQAGGAGIAAPAKQSKASSAEVESNPKRINNPQTGDMTSITALVLMLVGSSLFLANRYYLQK